MSVTCDALVTRTHELDAELELMRRERDGLRARLCAMHRRAQAAERAVRVAQGATRDAKRNDYYHGWAAADVRERLRRERDAARAELTLRDLARRDDQGRAREATLDPEVEAAIDRRLNVLTPDSPHRAIPRVTTGALDAPPEAPPTRA